MDIRFPQSGAPDPNCVTVTGLPENVEEAIDHILNLEEEYVSSEQAWSLEPRPSHNPVTANLSASKCRAQQGGGWPLGGCQEKVALAGCMLSSTTSPVLFSWQMWWTVRHCKFT